VALVASGLGAAQAADNYVKGHYAVCTHPSHGISGWSCRHYHLNRRNAMVEALAHGRQTGHGDLVYVLDAYVLRRECVP
jgi:hypothetical protein